MTDRAHHESTVPVIQWDEHFCRLRAAKYGRATTMLCMTSDDINISVLCINVIIWTLRIEFDFFTAH